jgi:hypothetical protein
MIYVLIGLIVIVLAYIEGIVKSLRFSFYSLIFIGLIMVLLAGMRDRVGTDWDAYFDFYKETTDRVEIGYGFLNNMFSKLSIPYNLFLLFINGFSLCLMVLFMKRHTFFPVLAMLIFYSDLYLYFNLSGIRQALALSITCFSITYALNKQFVKFLLLVLLAACFHSSAIVFLIAYFLPRGDLNLRHLVLFSVGFIGLSLFLDSISDLITLYTLKDANYYINSQEKAGNLLGLFYVGIIKRLIIIGIILTFGKRIFQHLRYFFNIYLFGFAIYLCTYMISPDIGVRLSSYFTIFDIILAGNLVYFIESRGLRISLVTIFALMAIYKLFGYMSDQFYQYNSIFNFF